MKKIIIYFLIVIFLTLPVFATEYTAPAVPEGAKNYMPEENETFAQGLWYIFKKAVSDLEPDISSASESCLALIAVVFLISVLGYLSNNYLPMIRLSGAVSVSLLMIKPIGSFVSLGISTVQQLSGYGKLLLPVMTSALAAQGGGTKSATIYTGTIFFDTILSALIEKIIVPLIYGFLCFSIAECVSGQQLLRKFCDLIKWLITWSLKWILYLFTGYISVTGVISGVVDASALKVTKITISGMVPVIGSVIADASETILVSAQIMKNAAGIYGIFALLALFISPFLKIGIQYILIKFSSFVCGILGDQPVIKLILDFSTCMGLILATTGAVCLLQLISLVCFMKGIN